MKILVILFVALALFLGSFEANAKRVFPYERQLLSDANLGLKVSAGPTDKVATQSTKGAEKPEIKAKNGAHDINTAASGEVNENDDVEDSGSSSHRYFPDDQHQPTPTNNNVNKPRP